MATQDRNPYFFVRYMHACLHARTQQCAECNNLVPLCSLHDDHHVSTSRTQQCAECNNLVPLCSLHDDHHVSTCHNHGDRSESCVPHGICIGTCILCFSTDKLHRIPIPTLRLLSHCLAYKFNPAQKDVHWGCRFAWRRCFNRQ